VSKAATIRDAWHPQTRHDREAILLELQEILASPHFCNSKRYPALLKYIVEKTLAGESDLLKERTLGVEVFDRPASYDTNADTVVRYTAGEVRKRLSLYYHELERSPAIQISLPAGCYIPEFFHLQDDPEDSAPANLSHVTALPEPLAPMHEMESISSWALPNSSIHSIAEAEVQTGLAHEPPRRRAGRRPWWIFAAAITTVLLAGLAWRVRTAQPRTPLDSFWTPILHDQSAMMVCIGGSVFSLTHTSGVATATKDVEYPFISIQSAAAAAQLSALLERNGGVTTELRSAATTPLTELREHPVILLGGYNNPWTVRLLQPLRFHFSPDNVAESIVDDSHPGVRWQRDESVPYSSADDYALVARFHDATTDSWVVALAGVGRNGTEAAAQFATSPHYMQLLRDKTGTDFANRNIEVVLKVNVIDGKTGAPAILAWSVW